MSATGNHLLLSLLWLAGSLPVVTLPVATSALFEVTRRRGGAGADSDLVPPGSGRFTADVRSFVEAFREHLRSSLVAGGVLAAVGLVLLADLAITGGMSQPAGDVARVALLALLLLYGLSTVALFPVLVSYRAPGFQLLRTAVVVALLFPLRSLLGLAVVVAAAAVTWLVPPTILIMPSLAATAIWRLYAGAFDRLRASVRVPVLTPLVKEILR